jgi:heme/copper-type cytochrome/quinol oxidase subunit 1
MIFIIKVKVMERLKKVFAQIFLTWLGRFGLAGLFIIVGGFMSPYGSIGELIDYKRDFTIWDLMLYVGAFIAVSQTLVFITYGWVINPIRDYKNRKK